MPQTGTVTTWAWTEARRYQPLEHAFAWALVLIDGADTPMLHAVDAGSPDADLAAMAKSFRLSRWRTLCHVSLPQLSPFFLIASRNGLALIWKIVLVVELLGRPDGIGYAIQVFFQLFDVKRLIAYSLAFVAVVLSIEWGILQPFERRLARWRR